MKDLQCLLELFDSIVYVVEVKLTDGILRSFLGLSDRFIVICISFNGSAPLCWSVGLNWLRCLGWLNVLLRVWVLDRLSERILTWVLVDRRGDVLCRGQYLRLVLGERLASWGAERTEAAVSGLLLFLVVDCGLLVFITHFILSSIETSKTSICCRLLFFLYKWISSRWFFSTFQALQDDTSFELAIFFSLGPFGLQSSKHGQDLYEISAFLEVNCMLLGNLRGCSIFFV